MLVQCIDLLDQLGEGELGKLLGVALQDDPLPVPEDHKGFPASHMFRLGLSSTQRLQVLRAMQVAVDRGLETPQTRRRGLGGFVEAWREYAKYQG